MDERNEVEGSKNEVSLPRDVGKTGGNGPCQGEAEHPDNRLSGGVCGGNRETYQFVAADNATAFARTRIGKISAAYVQDTGPIVMAKEQTKR